MTGERPAPEDALACARDERRERARPIMARLERSPQMSNSDLREAIILALEEILAD